MAYQNVHIEEQNSYLILDFTCIYHTSYYGCFSNMAATKFDQKGSFKQISYFSELLVDLNDFMLFSLLWMLKLKFSRGPIPNRRGRGGGIHSGQSKMAAIWRLGRKP